MVPVANRPQYYLERIVDALNGKLEWEEELGEDDALVQKQRFKETPPLLRKLVLAWQLSGPDLFKFSCDNREMWADVERYFEVQRLNPIRLLGAPGGGAAFFMNSRPERDPYQEALRLFIELLLNPKCKRLAGPCASCKAYFIPIRRSALNKYCSRFCGTRSTAIAATQKRRDEEHAAKLLRSEEAAREWITARRKNRTKKEWKAWVSARHPDITVKFLTRAVTNKELKSPTKGKKP
jgi:hypothetical protein